MPIGPSLPPHLAHLARASSPDDEAGPSVPRSTTPPGPATADNDDDAGDYGPALPPHLAARRSKPSGPAPPAPGPSYRPDSVNDDGPLPPRPSRPTPSRAVGPAPPPDDDSDDDIGPRLEDMSGAQEKTAVQEWMEREERWAKEREEKNKPKVATREEWMLVPPTSGVLSSVDPLRKRPTTFSRSAAPVETDSTVWTETPAEKAQRIADEVAGIKRVKEPKRGVPSEDRDEEARKRRRDEQIDQEVQRHNKSSRGKSMLDKHLEKGGKPDEQAAIWDHDRDMGITGRLLNDQERQAKIKEARGLNDRFGHSAHGAYSM
ncbi:hypothetical protein EHS25_000547 [Saitozyma podzolica]|uniref:DUF3752 domain-containing protein n=1 Tax=Saitozyma podzolica TaxID=1890683 RepID=A0A427YWP7_9TREE|nr:hypothetical protein EHS25_000547 [Saitozyma podzolica]